MAEIGLEGSAHGVDEAVGAPRLEALLPPEAEHLHAATGAVDARLDPAGEPVAEEDREHVVAPSPLALRDVDLPCVVEVEKRTKEIAVPDERIERREEHDGGRWLRRRREQIDLVAEDEAFAAQALDLDRNKLAVLDELLAQLAPRRVLRSLRIRPRGAQAEPELR